MPMIQIEAELWAIATQTKYAHDVEKAHIEADKLLIVALRQCWSSPNRNDVEGVIKAFEAVPKWYA